MGLKEFFKTSISNEKKEIKKNKDGIVAVSILEGFLTGAIVLGSMAGIFTLPSLLVMTIPGVFGVSMIKDLKKTIKASKDRIENLKNLEQNGVSAARNHERNLKVKELTEERNKEQDKSHNFSKVMLGGIAAFALGGFVPTLAAVSLPLMLGGYGTMLYGLAKSSEHEEKSKEYQAEIYKLKDSINAANQQPRVMATTDKGKTKVEEVGNGNDKKKTYSKKQETAVDRYIERLAKTSHYEEESKKTK